MNKTNAGPMYTPMSQMPMSQMPMSQMPMPQMPMPQMTMPQTTMPQMTMHQMTMPQMTMNQMPMQKMSTNQMPLHYFVMVEPKFIEHLMHHMGQPIMVLTTAGCIEGVLLDVNVDHITLQMSNGKTAHVRYEQIVYFEV